MHSENDISTELFETNELRLSIDQNRLEIDGNGREGESNERSKVVDAISL